jgi:hypothetical protein
LLKNALQEKESQLKDAEEQLRDIMFYLSSQEKIQQSPMRNEIQNGTIELKPQSSRSQKRKGKKS